MRAENRDEVPTMLVQHTGKRPVCVIPIRSDDAHVVLERKLKAASLDAYVSPRDALGRMEVHVVVSEVNETTAEHIYRVLAQQNCTVIQN